MIQSQLNNCSIWEFSSEIKKFELKVTGNICAAKYLQHVFMILFRLLFFTASNTFNSLLSYCPSWAATAKEISTPVYFFLPVNAGALYTQSDAQIDAGPARVWLTTVTAAGVAWDDQNLLQGTLSLQQPLLLLPTRVQTPRGCGRFPVQLLAWEKR